MKKFLITILLTLAVACILSGCSTISRRVDSQIEMVGSELTGVPVTVDVVDIKIARGIGEIQGFRVANPEGYADRYAISWELLHLNLGILSTIAGDPIVLDKLIISYPLVNLEINDRGGSNLKDLADNAGKNKDRADQKSAEDEPASKETPNKPVRFIIHELYIEGVTLNVRRVDGTLRSAILPTIRLEDVGGVQGTTPGGLGVAIIGAMVGEMIKQVVARELIEGAGTVKESLSTDNILSLLEDRLILTHEQMTRIRPAVEKVSSALVSTINTWVDNGFVDLAELSRQLSPVFQDFRERLRDVLDVHQFAKVKELIAGLEDNAIEVIRYIALTQIEQRLDMTPDQFRQVRPILHEYFVKVSDLIDEIAKNPEGSFDELKTRYEAEVVDLRTKLAEKLTNEQIGKLVSLLQKIQARLKDRFASPFFTIEIKPLIQAIPVYL